MQRKLNLLLLLFSLIGGAVAFVIGELLLGRLLGDWPSILVVGLYFAIVALGVGLGCLLAEMISPRLNGWSWRRRYLGLSWKLLPLTVVMLLGVGVLMEFVYELNFGGMKPVKDIVMVIDDSGSMQQSDPGNSRYSAARDLVMLMDGDNKVAVLTFSDEAAVVQPLTSLSKAENREQVTAAIQTLQTTQGGTNLREALTEAMNVINGDNAAGRGAMVILLSDGVSQLDTRAELQEYVDRGIAVNTIGLSISDPSGPDLLRDIAGTTGGQYYDVADANRLADIFRQIYDRLGDRTLLTERTDNTQHSPYYATLRILSLVLIGAALGLGLGIVFDNRHLAKSFGLGGIVSGLLAGLTLEFGLGGHAFLNAMVRLLAVLLLAGVLALFTAVVPVGEGRLTRRGRGAEQPSARPSQGYSPRRNRSSKGF
ncbi:vWA domain-containing protein [Paenibacillus rhizophilus]|uniref:VWA domain-containing protein n=1 Tax=Paenibacillus rhizophilus TaxID=1850366 RepID=A0A3N9P0X0_9BACL|nr:vWA domain-containing protein [Paenibacillus rhizophilus]RQW09823.1 VWA domain-containing protein [Paenibacillus rhizophilus]